MGALRRDNQWLSGPILNRGAIAWNDSGQFYFGRLTLEETLITPNNLALTNSVSQQRLRPEWYCSLHPSLGIYLHSPD